MDSLADVLSVALGSGGVATVLASSLSIWLKQRRADVSVEVSAPDGSRVKVTATRVRDAEAVIRQLLGEETSHATAGRTAVESDLDRE